MGRKSLDRRRPRRAAGRLVGVVREQTRPGRPRARAASAPRRRTSARRRRTPAPRSPRTCRARVLQGVGVDLVVEPDPPPLLSQVDQVAARLVQPRRPPRPAAGRSRSARCPARPRSGTRCAAGPAARRPRLGSAPVAQRHHEVLRPVHEAVEGVAPRRRRPLPRQAQRHPHRAADGGGRDRDDIGLPDSAAAKA